jgi:hypothetical protein
MRKKVQWPVMHLYGEKLRRSLNKLKKRMNSLMRNEKLIGGDFGYRPLTTEEGVHEYFQPWDSDAGASWSKNHCIFG